MVDRGGVNDVAKNLLARPAACAPGFGRFVFGDGAQLAGKRFDELLKARAAG